MQTGLLYGKIAPLASRNPDALPHERRKWRFRQRAPSEGSFLSSRRTWHPSLYAAALFFYAGLTFLTLYPIIFGSGVQVAGYDFFNYNWNFWWIRHALTTPGLNVYASNYAMFPYTTNYGYHALTAVWYPLWALLEPLLGTLTAVNAIILLVATLNGFLVFVLLRRERVSAGLALIGGAALQVSPILRYFYFNTHLNLMDWFWLPAELLLWQALAQAIAARRTRRTVLLAAVQGATLWGILLTDLQFPIFTAMLLGPYVLYTLWRSPARLRLIAAGVLVAAVALPLAWFAGPLPHILTFSGTLAPGTVEDRPGIPLSGLFTMSQTWWEWSSPSLGAFVTVVVLASLGFELLRRRQRPQRGRWGWLLLALVPLLLALGPNLTLGEQTIPLPPFRLLYAQTNGMFKMPWRLAPIFIIAALIFVGQTWTPLFRRITAGRRFALVAVLLLLALDVRLFESAPLQPAPVDYAFYHTIGAEPYTDEVILEVPTGAATGDVILGDPRATQLQYYGITHGKRMVNGFISRAPLENYWYLLTDDPLLSWLGQRRYLEPEKVEPELRDHIFNWPIGYIVIHRDLIGRDSSTVQEILGYFNALNDLLCPYTVEGDAVVYRTRWHPDGCLPRIPPETAPGSYTLDIGAPGDEGFVGWGWHYAEDIAGLTLRWTGAYPQTQVYLDLPPGDYQIELAAQSYWEPRQLRLLVNDTPLGDPVTVTPDALHDYTFQLPADVLGSGQAVRLTLDYDAVVIPANVGQGADTRQLAVAVDWIRFTRLTAGS